MVGDTELESVTSSMSRDHPLPIPESSMIAVCFVIRPDSGRFIREHNPMYFGP